MVKPNGERDQVIQSHLITVPQNFVYYVRISGDKLLNKEYILAHETLIYVL